MALVTWKDMLERGERGRATGIKGPLQINTAEYKKAFDYYIKKGASKYKTKPKWQQLENLSDLINDNIRRNKGKFKLGPGQGFRIQDPSLQWDALVKADPNAPQAFENYLKNKAKSPAILEIAKKKIPLKTKYELLGAQYQQQARKSMQAFKALEGRINLKTFGPLTNFSDSYLKLMFQRFDWPIPKVLNADNIRDAQYTINAKRFKEFFKDNNIEVFQKAAGTKRHPESTKPGDLYFTDVRNNPAQVKALNAFLNLKAEPSNLQRNKLIRLARDSKLYVDTSKNLKTLLRGAQDNLNSTIQGYNDKGLRSFLKKYPKVLKNATMWFNGATGKINYTPLSDIYKKDYNMSKLRDNLKFEIEHNRSINDYWKNLTTEGKITAKNKLLLDAEFAHNLSVDTSRYNKGAKTAIVNWMEKNPHRTTEIAALEKELGELGHRFYAGGEWKGRGVEIKSGYRDTVMDSWKTALEKSTGLKWDDQLKNVSKRRWEGAMKEVMLDPKQLRILGTFFGCPGTFKSYDEGGRVRLASGGQGLSACVSTKLKQPGSVEKIAQLPEETGGALGKLKNVAKGFLNFFVPKPDMPSVKYDDTLGAFVDTKTDNIASQAELKTWADEHPMEVKVGEAKPGILRKTGKALAHIGLPLPTAAMDAYFIGRQVEEGKSPTEIAKDPFNWLGLATMDPLTKAAGMTEKSGKLASALRLGMSPGMIRGASRFLGLPGLALSTGLTAYDQYQKYKNKEGFVYDLFNREEIDNAQV